MGFGILFYGFLMMIEITVRTQVGSPVGIDIFPDLAGYLLMLAAACRLDGYAKGFSYFRKLLYPLIVLGAAAYAIGMLSLLGKALALLETLSNAVKLLSLALQGVAFFFLFAGVISLANEVDLPGIATRARYTAIVGTVYYVFQLVLSICYQVGMAQKTLAPFSFTSMVIFIVFVLLGEVVLFNCYRYICYEGEENYLPSSADNPIARFMNKLFKKSK